MTRRRASLTLTALIALSVALRAFAGLRVDGPWISPDETVYALVGQSLFRHGTLEILGGPTPFYSLVVPLLVGPFLSFGDLELGYSLLKPFLALVMSLAAVPTYLWARGLVGTRRALVAAALVLAAPALAYSGLVMSEVFFLPAMALAAWAAVQAIAEPSRATVARLAVACTLAMLTRLQALVLLPVVVGAVGLDAVFARSFARLRLTAPAVLGAAAPVALWFLFQQIRGEPALGAYESTSAAAYQAGNAARYVAYHAGALVLTSAFVPVCALLALVANAALRGERDARARATIAVTFALTAGVVAQVGVFASQHVGQIAGRDLLCIIPPLLVCLVLWLERDAGGPMLRAAAAGVTLALLSALPLSRFVTYHALFDSITLAPLWHLRNATSAGALNGVVFASAAVLGLAFAFGGRRIRLLLPAVLLTLGVAGSFASAGEMVDQARRTRDVLVGHDPRWIDDAANGRSATYVYDGGRDWPAVWQALFWNRSIRHVAVLGEVQLPGPAPQRPLRLRGDGRIDVRDPDVILPSSYTAEGTQVAEIAQLIPEQEGLRRWRLGATPRLLTRTLGLQAGGDIYANERGTLIAYGCAGGTWQLTFLVKEPQDVVVLQNGRPFFRRHYPPGTAADFFENFDLPAAPRPGTNTCRLDVLPTGLLGTTRFGFIPGQ